jgi:hypothetical protein
MKSRYFGVVSGLLFMQGVCAFAQGKSLQIRGALSIGFDDNNRWDGRTYSGATVPAGTKWTVRLGMGEPNASFAYCATKDGQSLPCVDNFNKSDQYGNWTSNGTFESSAIGSWTEWLRFPDGSTTNRIMFVVGDTPPALRFAINNVQLGVFHLGQTWALSFTSAYAYANKRFALCAEVNGTQLPCTSNFGIIDSNGSWTMSGMFDANAVGGWTEWLELPDGTISNQIAFTVDAVPPDDTTCSNGTIYTAGPNAGYTIFTRITSDWRPADPGDYAMVSGRGGGYGNTLEYTGCKGANYVWLEWEYNGFATVAVRAPWGGHTDRGLRIGDTLARFQSLYPSAHHTVSQYSWDPYWPNWPADLDVWDNGPLRVAFQNGQVAMMEVYWDAWNYPADDQTDSGRSTIGPWESAIAWHQWN